MSSHSTPPRGFYPATKHAAQGVIPLKPMARAVVPISPFMRLKELLARPDAAALVRSTPVQDLYLLVKQVGLSDVIELLELAQPDQLQRMLDLDIWDRDTFSAERYAPWLEALLEAKADRLRVLVDGLDIEPLLLFLKEHVTVHLKEDDAPEAEILDLEARHVAETPDHRYLLEMSPDDDMQDFIHQLIHKIYSLDMKIAHWLLESLRWELTSQLQEQAYHHRTGRIEELGFVDFYEALTLYAPLRGVRPQHRVRLPQPMAGPLRDVPMSLESIRPTDGSFLGRALERLRERHPDDDLARDLVRLGNKVMAAERLNAGELEDLEKALLQVRAYVGLGLELQSNGDLENAVGLLRTVHIEWLFRRGYSETLNVQRRAKALLLQLRPALRRLPGVHADPPHREALIGAMSLHPQYFTGLEGAQPGTFAPFQNRAQLENTNAALAGLEAIYRFVFEVLAPAPVELATLRAGLDTYHLELTPASVFLTSLAQSLLGGPFAPEPLDAEQLRLFVQRIFLQDADPGGLKSFSAEFLAQLEDATGVFAGTASPGEIEAVRGFVERALGTLRDAYGALDLSRPFPLHLIGGPLILKA